MNIDKIITNIDTLPPAVQRRYRNEVKLVTWCIDKILATGNWKLRSVDIGEGDTKIKYDEAGLSEIFAGDEALVFFRHVNNGGIAWFQGIWGNGNEGWDALGNWSIPDPSDGFDEALEAVWPEIEKWKVGL